MQKVPVDGAVIISTPQDMALIDVKRCVDMFERVKTPILGLIENMAVFTCPHCEKDSELFPKGALTAFCAEKNIPILAEIAFNSKIGEGSEAGIPFVKAHVNSKEMKASVERQQILFQDLISSKEWE